MYAHNTIPLLALFHHHFSPQSHMQLFTATVQQRATFCLLGIRDRMGGPSSTVVNMICSLLDLSLWAGATLISYTKQWLNHRAVGVSCRVPALAFAHSQWPSGHTRAQQSRTEQSISQTEWSRLQLAETGTTICTQRAHRLEKNMGQSKAESIQL